MKSLEPKLHLDYFLFRAWPSSHLSEYLYILSIRFEQLNSDIQTVVARIHVFTLLL